MAKTITGTLHYLESGQLVLDWGAGNFLALKFTNSKPDEVKTIKVGLDPSQGSGLVPLDEDMNGVFKITDKDTQKFVVECYDENDQKISRDEYDLSGLVCETPTGPYIKANVPTVISYDNWIPYTIENSPEGSTLDVHSSDSSKLTAGILSNGNIYLSPKAEGSYVVTASIKNNGETIYTTTYKVTVRDMLLVTINKAEYNANGWIPGYTVRVQITENNKPEDATRELIIIKVGSVTNLVTFAENPVTIDGVDYYVGNFNSAPDFSANSYNARYRLYLDTKTIANKFLSVTDRTPTGPSITITDTDPIEIEENDGTFASYELTNFDSNTMEVSGESSDENVFTIAPEYSGDGRLYLSATSGAMEGDTATLTAKIVDKTSHEVLASDSKGVSIIAVHPEPYFGFESEDISDNETYAYNYCENGVEGHVIGYEGATIEDLDNVTINTTPANTPLNFTKSYVDPELRDDVLITISGVNSIGSDITVEIGLDQGGVETLATFTIRGTNLEIISPANKELDFNEQTSSGSLSCLYIPEDATVSNFSISCATIPNLNYSTQPSGDPGVFDVTIQNPLGTDPTLSGSHTCVLSLEINGNTETDTLTINFSQAPDGKTVTPTDAVQTLLQCAGILDKSYTTINEVLADQATLGTVIASKNAADYLVRSTTFASAMAANQTAMTDIGADNYCADTLLCNSTWLNAIYGSSYRSSVLNVAVPQMTSNTAPSGVVTVTSTYSGDWKSYGAFNDSYQWYATSNNSQYVQYQFPEAMMLKAFEYQPSTNAGYAAAGYTITLQASNDGSTWTQLATHSGIKSRYEYGLPLNETAYKYYRMNIYCENPGQYSICPNAYKIQYYGRKDV